LVVVLNGQCVRQPRLPMAHRSQLHGTQAGSVKTAPITKSVPMFVVWEDGHVPGSGHKRIFASHAREGSGADQRCNGRATRSQGALRGQRISITQALLHLLGTNGVGAWVGG